MQTHTVLPTERIASRILALREQRVMLDADLAELYGVETRVLIQAIKRNAVRFPADFMFQLSAEEFANLRSQFVISSSGTGYRGRRYAPYAFTEQGVAMLSTVLNSERAVVINIEIMCTFVKVRTLARTQKDLAKQLTELQEKTESLSMSHDTLSRNTKAQLRVSRKTAFFDTSRFCRRTSAMCMRPALPINAYPPNTLAGGDGGRRQVLGLSHLPHGK